MNLSDAFLVLLLFLGFVLNTELRDVALAGDFNFINFQGPVGGFRPARLAVVIASLSLRLRLTRSTMREEVILSHWGV